MVIKIETISSTVELAPINTFIQRRSCQRTAKSVYLYISTSVLKTYFSPKLGSLICVYPLLINACVEIKETGMHIYTFLDLLMQTSATL